MMERGVNLGLRKSNMKKYVEVNFDKPLYDYQGRYMIRLWDKYINDAKRTRRKLRITVPNVGVGIYTWREWMKGAEYFEQVYLKPDEPMKLWGNYFDKDHGLSDDREVKKVIEDVSIPTDIKSRLREEAIKMGIYKPKYT